MKGEYEMAGANQWGNLEQLIDRAESGGGTVGISISASNGLSFGYNEQRMFKAASTVKIPIMIQIFRRIDRGELTLDQEYTVTSGVHTMGSGVLHEMHDGLVVTIQDLLYLMMSISDNTATNILIDMAGMDDVNATMRELGMEKSTLGRKMQGKAASGKQSENWAAPAEYADLVQKLLAGEAASPESCEKMVAILEQQQNGRRIGRYIPEEGVRWGSKTGSITGVTNDVGFVTSSAGTVVVSVYCEDLPDQHVGEQLIGDVAREAVVIAGVAEPLRTS